MKLPMMAQLKAKDIPNAFPCNQVIMQKKCQERLWGTHKFDITSKLSSPPLAMESEDEAMVGKPLVTLGQDGICKTPSSHTNRPWAYKRKKEEKGCSYSWQ